MSKELDSVQVPLSYMVEFYNLRLHIRLVEDDLKRVLTDQNAEASTGTPSAASEDISSNG